MLLMFFLFFLCHTQLEKYAFWVNFLDHFLKEFGKHDNNTSLKAPIEKAISRGPMTSP